MSRESIDDILHKDDINNYLNEVAEQAASIENIIIVYATSDSKLFWKGLGRRTNILGLLEAAKYELLKETDDSPS